MRSILLTAIAIGCGAAAPIKPLKPPYVLLQREYFDLSAKPYGFTACGISYRGLNGTNGKAEALAAVETDFQNPVTGATQTSGRQQMFLTSGDWQTAVADASNASAPFQKGALSFDGCPINATVRTLLVDYPHDNKHGVTVLAVRCEQADGTVTGATTAASTYLAQLMRGAVPTCAAIDEADFATMPVQMQVKRPNLGE